MSRKKSTSKDLPALQAENEALKRQLQQAKLKIEGYQIMGDILGQAENPVGIIIKRTV